MQTRIKLDVTGAARVEGAGQDRAVADLAASGLEGHAQDLRIGRPILSRGLVLIYK
jgi:hypothetical protein